MMCEVITILFIAHHVLSSGDLNWVFIAGYETPLQIKAKLTAVLQNSDLSTVTEKKVMWYCTVQTCAEVGAYFGIGACLPPMEVVMVADVAVVRVQVQVTTAVEAAAGSESLQYQARAANAYQQRQPPPISRGDLFF